MLTIAQALDLAARRHEAGRLIEAEQLCHEVLRVTPQSTPAIHRLGVIAYQSGRLDLAADYFEQVLHIDPRHAEASCNLGMVLAGQGKLAEAVGFYQRALQLNPDLVAAHMNIANAHLMLGRLDDAVAGYEAAIRLKPDYPEALCNLGLALLQQEKPAEAERRFQSALRLRPDDAGARGNLAVALLRQGKHAEAVTCFQEALRLMPDAAELHGNLAMALVEQGKPAEAEAAYRAALRLDPNLAGCHCDLGVLLAEQGRLPEAEACYRRALDLRPDDAEVHTNLAYNLLLRGDFESGWREYRWRLICRGNSLPSFPQPHWDGSALRGQRILFVAEQGLGDTIQFIRYAPLVRETGARVLVLCQGPLLRLLSTQAGIHELIPEGSTPPAFDVQAPLLSLPEIFGTTLSTIPAAVPYLTVLPEWRERWSERMSSDPAFKVGIAWRGNPAHKRDGRRSVALSTFAPLAGVPGVRLISLQVGPGREQLADHAEEWNVFDPGDQLEDFADTAGLLSHLDLVVTVDTAVGHLAGALGVPVWVALPRAPDWRWLLERDDSPWYPSMRLFRQTAPGDWTEVFQRMTDALKRAVEKSRGQ